MNFPVKIGQCDLSLIHFACIAYRSITFTFMLVVTITFTCDNQESLCYQIDKQEWNYPKPALITTVVIASRPR